MEKLEYEKSYKIPVYEIGFDGQLSPHSLFKYLQDIASEHAVLLGFGKEELLKENHFWVLSRIAAKIYKWPEWEDTIIVRTWPRGTDRLFAIRDFEIVYPDGRPLAMASSSWVVVDLMTRRVQRPNSLLTSFNSDLPVKIALGRNCTKLEPPSDNYVLTSPFRVQISDLDINLHVNNVIYSKWIADSYDLEFRKLHYASFVEINYLTESRLHDEIIIKTSADKNNDKVYNHSVVRTVDNAELCRVQMQWEDCPQRKVY
jgi:medium-chain acyl-[acyl-carrier-protein] hydrolase